MFDLIFTKEKVYFGPGWLPAIFILWLACYIGLIARDVKEYGRVIETVDLFWWALIACFMPITLPILGLGKVIEWSFQGIQRLHDRWMVHVGYYTEDHARLLQRRRKK